MNLMERTEVAKLLYRASPQQQVLLKASPGAVWGSVERIHEYPFQSQSFSLDVCAVTQTSADEGGSCVLTAVGDLSRAFLKAALSVLQLKALC